MPQFFFDVTDRDDLTRDAEGAEFADRDAVRKEALEALAGIARDAASKGDDRRDVHIDVRDAERRVIFTACMALTARWLD